MVMIQVKKTAAAAGAAEEQEFLYECSCSSTVDEVAGAVLEISKLQSRIQTLSLHLRHRLLTDAFRDTSPVAALGLDRTLAEAEAYASRDQVLYKRALSPRTLGDHLQTIEKEVRVAHSKGLCDSDVLQLFSDCEVNEDARLWWAGKELRRGKRLCDYIGVNEKTKIIIRLKPACLAPQSDMNEFHDNSGKNVAETISDTKGTNDILQPRSLNIQMKRCCLLLHLEARHVGWRRGPLLHASQPCQWSTALVVFVMLLPLSLNFVKPLTDMFS